VQHRRYASGGVSSHFSRTYPNWVPFGAVTGEYLGSQSQVPLLHQLKEVQPRVIIRLPVVTTIIAAERREVDSGHISRGFIGGEVNIRTEDN
jgi:hypothetical protein